MLHVDPAALSWIRYAVAAVPPVAAAMLALAALLRQVCRLAEHAALEQPAAPHPAASGNGHGAPEGGKEATELAAGELPSVRRVQREMHLGQPRAQQVRSYLEVLAGSNGHG